MQQQYVMRSFVAAFTSVWFCCFVAPPFILLNNSNSILCLISHLFFFSRPQYTCFTSTFDDILHFIQPFCYRSCSWSQSFHSLMMISNIIIIISVIFGTAHHVWVFFFFLSFEKEYNEKSIQEVRLKCCYAWKYNVNKILVNSNVSPSTT